MKNRIRSAQIVLPCANLQETLDFFIERLGFRLEMISPADLPSTAVISGYGLNLRLESAKENQSPSLILRLLGDFSSLAADVPREIFSPDGVRVILTEEKSSIEIPEGKQEFVLTALDENSWHAGRAGMQYRDLIPGRLGGRFIASHIRSTKAGEIPDYVHYHRVRFQMIYCLAGRARLVYEDQGAPFVMKTGDSILQPPEIRHRVLESSADFEVLEISSPAIHETFADHRITLPNETAAPERLFGGQRFVHHAAEKSVWKGLEIGEMESRDTGISEATGGMADVCVLRANADAKFYAKHSGEFLFFFILKGNLRLSDSEGQTYLLKAGSSFVLPSDEEFFIDAESGLEMLRVTFPAQ